ncbi:carbohydrate ABC transporter permease [Breznakiella homolactica]|uniref:Sugar ABC transporter permease n=1 Tax=Breznakiella homolactica TaxID=2798577 RepID=A0A7T7XRR1_9SPIR|nr:sugar ABC transporter permease [Breznakiella homolactica]QQO11242.1 sugar ABC transporter permease [Breznakiella homolactica]
MKLKKITRSGVLYVVPAMLIIALVMLYPLIYTLVMGFFKNTLQMRTPVFAGFSQYFKLFNDEVFIKSIGNTVVWTVGSVFLQFVLGFMVAMLLHQPFVKFKALLRILLMVPWVLPSIIGSSVWKWMYNADYGIINFLLKSLHIIDSNRTWLSNPKTAMAAVIAVNAWKMFPFVLLMIEAALQGVSKDLKEAAIIDGSGKLGIFRNVTWPSIAPACYSVLLLLMIWTLNAFTFVYNLTLGGPAHATEVMAMFIYNKAFTQFDFGMASAASTILFLLSIFVSIFYIRMTKKNEEI